MTPWRLRRLVGSKFVPLLRMRSTPKRGVSLDKRAGAANRSGPRVSLRSRVSRRARAVVDVLFSTRFMRAGRACDGGGQRRWRRSGPRSAEIGGGAPVKRGISPPGVSSRAAHRSALFLLALCGVLWSSAGVLLKWVDWHPAAIWSARSAIAATALWLVRRPSLRGMRGGEWAAGIALAATTGLFILANKLTTAANAILIQY